MKYITIFSAKSIFKGFLKSLAVKLQTTANHPNHPHHPQTSQTTHNPVKYWKNLPLISQKSHLSFPGDIFMIRYNKFRIKNRNICHPTKYDPFTHLAGEDKWVHFFIFLPDFAFCLLNCTVIYDP